jgi:hypothetical protein
VPILPHSGTTTGFAGPASGMKAAGMRTGVCELLGIEQPIIQAPIGTALAWGVAVVMA